MRYFFKHIVFCGVLALHPPVFAAGYGLSPHTLLPLQISTLGPTRIEFDGQKIADVFFYPKEAAKVVLHQSGSVFVVPQEGHKHIYITLMGEEGDTHDLRLRFVMKQPDPIRLVLPRPRHKKTKSHPLIRKKGHE